MKIIKVISHWSTKGYGKDEYVHPFLYPFLFLTYGGELKYFNIYI
jgi:hypothetical protein